MVGLEEVGEESKYVYEKTVKSLCDMSIASGFVASS